MNAIAQAVLAGLALAMSSAAPFAEAVDAEPAMIVDTEGLPTHVRERIEEKAQDGRTALVQYLHRTQAVHQLRPEFVIVGEEYIVTAKKKKEEVRLARVVRPRV